MISVIMLNCSAGREGAGRSGIEVVALLVTPKEMGYLQNLSLTWLSQNAASS